MGDSSVVGSTFAQLGGGHPQRCDRCPAEHTGATDATARPTDRAVERRPEPRRELAAHAAGALGDELGERSQHRERHERQPVQDEGDARGVGHAPVQLRRSTDAVLGASRQRLATEQFDGSGAGNPGRGHPDDTVAGQAGPHAEVERGIHAGEARVEAAEGSEY